MKESSIWFACLRLDIAHTHISFSFNTVIIFSRAFPEIYDGRTSLPYIETFIAFRLHSTHANIYVIYSFAGPLCLYLSAHIESIYMIPQID